MKRFKLASKYKPSGDQPKAIKKLTDGVHAGIRDQTLLGVTGSGKTYTMANVIQETDRPALIISHNKTLSAQLFSEFKDYFPENAVEYFVSYYDYYQPEAYIAKKDLYIEKDAEINKNIEKYRSSATQSLLSRKDVIVVASVSCIYGLGNPEDYMSLTRHIKVGERYTREKFLIYLHDLQYERTEYGFEEGTYRVRGEIIDIRAATGTGVRIEFFGDEIESIILINPVTGEKLENVNEYKIFPAKQFVTPQDKLRSSIEQIEVDLEKEVKEFKDREKIFEAKRLEQRTRYDIEMLQELGYCSGIENYSRYIDGRAPGTPPSTLLDYFPSDWLMFVDESHITLPQIKGMYNGDRARKSSLVEHGFRLKAAKDNRPLKFEEFDKKINQAIYVSATPKELELEKSKISTSKTREKKPSLILKEYNGIVEQIIRPTGLLDPMIFLRPAFGTKYNDLQKSIKEQKIKDDIFVDDSYHPSNQIDDLIKEIRSTIKSGERVLVTTLTKRMAEELTNFLLELDIKVQYLHSDIDTIERVEILRDLRLGKYDVVVGINLLREGLDLPEVSLVAILDADKEGFLRSYTSLTQTIGRAARHQEGKVIMYADKVTDSMKVSIEETSRRRKIQEEYNTKHNITPKTIKKDIKEHLKRIMEDDEEPQKGSKISEFIKEAEGYKVMPPKEKRAFEKELDMQMKIYADMLEFEKAAKLRDILDDIRNQ